MVSIVIATFRRDSSLSNALASLLEQTYKDFEVVLVDDNADEKWNNVVGSIVSSYKGKLDIKYIKNTENKGSAKTRNIGIDASRGEFITFLDDDDIYLPNKIKIQVEQMMEESADYSLMNLSLFNEDESLSENRKRDYLLTNESKNLLLCHLKYHMTGTDTMMFKKDYLVSFGGFETIDVGDEFYLMMRAIESNGKFVYCNACEVKAYVHTNDDGLSSGQRKIDGENRLYQFKKKYFEKLSLKDKRYIKMRHYAVLAFAYKRSHKIIRFFFEGFKAFLTAPFESMRLISNMKKNA